MLIINIMKEIRIIGLWITLLSFLLTACGNDDEKDVPLYELKLLSGLEVIIVPTGGSETIDLVFSPIHTTNKRIEWTSSNADIVTVENGIVTGIKAGESLVEAIPESNPQKKVSVRVIVNDIPVDTLTLDVEERIDLEVNDVLKINATITPENAPQEVEWLSSDNNIATVTQDGEVTALKGGEVIITARSVADGNKLASVTITISNPFEIALTQPADGTFLNGNSITYPVIFKWIKINGVTDYLLKISENKDDFSEAMTFEVGNTDKYEMNKEAFDAILDHFSVSAGNTKQLYWSITSSQGGDNITTNVFALLVQKATPLLDKQKFVALPHSSQFQFSPYGTSILSALWNNNSTTVGSDNIFYILNKTVTYFGIDLGVKATLSSFTYWGRRDYYFQQRHAKKLQVYGTNDSNVANNPESLDSEWILLNETPFVSTRPSGNTGKPVENDEDYLHAKNGEDYAFPAELPAVRYVRVKCLENWGNMEGLWATEIAFRGEAVE